jgi:hypothetical protein
VADQSPSPARRLLNNKSPSEKTSVSPALITEKKIVFGALIPNYNISVSVALITEKIQKANTVIIEQKPTIFLLF